MIKKFYRLIGDELSLNFNKAGVLASAQLKVDGKINVVTSYFPKLKEDKAHVYTLAFGFFGNESFKVPEGLYKFWNWLISNEMNIHSASNHKGSVWAVDVINESDRHIPCPKSLTVVYFDLDKDRVVSFERKYDLEAYTKISKYPK